MEIDRSPHHNEGASHLSRKENSFVSYLISLQRFGGGNENALAESQVCNRHFSFIHIKNPIVDTIYRELRDPKGKHVILTGHAGDGKSTLAMDVYKLLRGYEASQPLGRTPKPREDLDNFSIIKDLSERDRTEDMSLLEELAGGGRKFLIVSNTGTLIDFAKNAGNGKYFGQSSIDLESSVLESISSKSGKSELQLGSIRFLVFNLARMDNVGIARKVFEKMLSHNRWDACQSLDCSRVCPILLNVSLLKEHQGLGVERIFLAYRRMYEYGTRLTMRQFTEHLSYVITSGLKCQKIQNNFSQKPFTKHLFFNCFFGDNGVSPEERVSKVKGVQEVKRQLFGLRPSIAWEHRLWLRYKEEEIYLGVSSLEEEFQELRINGLKEEGSSKMTSGQARDQVRRILYFLKDFSQYSPEDQYLKHYLNTHMLLDWIGWQNSSNSLESRYRKQLGHKIYHILKEHFTGVRLPEWTSRSGGEESAPLYITLNRRQSEARQSVQVVLAEFRWQESISLEIDSLERADGETRNDLVMRGKGNIEGVELLLGVPFLDYVMMRYMGELGEVLEPIYVERLKSFKAKIQEKLPDQKDRITLIRLKANHTFHKQCFSIDGRELEVHDGF